MGSMSIVCSYCQALHWINERTSGSSKTTPSFEKCCKKGAVKLNEHQMAPDILRTLMTGLDPESRHFRQHIREYNSSLSFTSIRYTADERLARLPPGVKCFQIHGELYHLQGPLAP